MTSGSVRLRSVLVAFMAVVALLVVRPVQAALYVCRGDPIIELSDDTKLTIVASLTVPGTLVDEVVYTVHVPPGVNIRRITYLAGELYGKETVVLVRDAPRDTYRVETDVNLLLGGSLAEYLTEVRSDP